MDGFGVLVIKFPRTPVEILGLVIKFPLEGWVKLNMDSSKKKSYNVTFRGLLAYHHDKVIISFMANFGVGNLSQLKPLTPLRGSNYSSKYPQKR